MATRVALLDALDYAWRHPKRGNTFTGSWSYIILAKHMLSHSIKLAVESDRVTGIVVYDVVLERVHIHQILCDTKHALRSFLQELKLLYPNHKLSSTRKAGVYSNTDKLTRRLYGR